MNSRFRKFLSMLMVMALVMQYCISVQSIAVYAADESSEVQVEQEDKAEKKADPQPAPAEKSEPKAEEKSEPAPAPAPEPEPEKKEEPAAEPAAEPAGDSQEQAAPSGEQDPAPADEAAPQEDAGDQTDPGSEAPAEEEIIDEQPEEAVPEETEEEITYPEVSFTRNVNGMTIVIRAPDGALPEGSSVSVTAVSASKIQSNVEDALGGSARVVKAVDITFRDKDGKEIEPKVPVSVRFTSDAISGLNEPSVVHIDDRGSVDVVDDASVTKSGVAKFESDQFSIYAVIGEVVESRLAVNFKNGDTTIATVYVKEEDTRSELNDIVVDPGAGTLGDSEVFRGWTLDEEYTESSTTYTIDTLRDYIDGLDIDSYEDEEELNVYAMIFQVFNATYKDSMNIVIGNDGVLVSGGSAEYTLNQPFSPSDPDQDFKGWHISPADNATLADGTAIDAEAAYPNGTDLILTGSITLTVEAPLGAWLIFKENGKGADYTSPQFLEPGDVTVRPSNPTRLGYTFGGWYTDAECTDGNEFTFGSELATTTTVYAKWTPVQNAGYVVIIWKQHTDGESYDFAESVQLTGRVGTTINTVTAQGTGDNRRAVVNGRARTYEGFHLNTFDTDVTIAPEGTTVLNVYYDRNEITYTFHTYTYTYTPTTSNYGTQYGIVDGEYVELDNYFGAWYANGVRYRGTRYTRSNGRWTEYKTMTGLFGTTLEENGEVWPDEYDWYENGGNNGSVSGTHTTFLDAFIIPGGASSEDYYGRAAATGNSVVEFYKQRADLNGYEAVPANRVSTNVANPSFNISDKYEGFTAHHYTLNGRTVQLTTKDSDGYYATGVNYRNTTLRIYFNRTAYPLNYMDGTYFNGNESPIEVGTRQLKVVENLPYGSDISDQSYEPSGTGEYVFSGWYFDDACTQEATFTTMPDGGLTVYAKWVQKQYRVFLHPGVPTSENFDPPYGLGEQATSFRVTYGENIDSITGIRQDYELIGWYIDEGLTTPFNFGARTLNDSTPGLHSYDKSRPTELDKYGNPTGSENKDTDRPWITKCLDLYAKWSSKLEGAEGINVIYDAGDGTNAPEDPLFYKDNTNSVAGAASTPNSADKQFLHWVVQAYDESAGDFVDTDVEVYPGDSFAVLKDNARLTVNETGEDGVILDAVYEVQLRAEYGDLEIPTPTHIDWYANNETDEMVSDEGESGEGLQINEAVDIRPADTFSYTGYEFIGWARYEEGEKPESPTDDSNLWLYYDPDTDTFKENDSVAVTRVAADEKDPYHDLYAVWRFTEVEVPVHHYLLGTDSKVADDTSVVCALGEELDPSTVEEAEEFLAAFDGFTLTKDSTDPAEAVTVSKDTEIILYYTLPLTITAKTDSKPYDGTPLVGEFTIEGALPDDLAAIEEAAGEPISITEVFESPETYKAGEEGIPGYYVLTNTEGTLTIEPLQVTVTADDASKEAGDEDPEFTATVEGLLDGDSIEYTISRDPGEDAGEYDIIPTGDEEQGNYVVEYVNGTFTITEPDTPYKVEHYKESLAGEYELAETEDFTGKTGAEVEAEPKTYDGFTLNEAAEGTEKSGTIAEDGSLVLKLFYDRNEYEITYDLNGGEYDGSTENIVESYAYETEITIHEAPTREGYEFLYWKGSEYQPGDSYTVEGDHTFTAIWSAEATEDDDEEEEEPDEPEKSGGTSKGVKTGDENGLTAAIVILGASMLGLLAIIVRRKREQE